MVTQNEFSNYACPLSFIKVQNNLTTANKPNVDCVFVRKRVCLTHIVRQGCVVSLSASQTLCCLLQNLVVLFGKQSK